MFVVSYSCSVYELARGYRRVSDDYNYLADQCVFGRDWDRTPTPKSRSWQFHCHHCRSSQEVFGAGRGLVAWTGCRCRRIEIARVAETFEDATTVAEADTLLGSVTTAENERTARSAVHVVDRGRLKSAGSFRQSAEQSEIGSIGWMARTHGTKALDPLEEKSHENPDRN